MKQKLVIIASVLMLALSAAPDAGAQWVSTNGCSQTVYCFTSIGTNLFAGTDGGVFLSTDNGLNWDEVDTGLTNHDVYALAVGGKNLFAGTNTGVFLSSNNGTTWMAINGSKLDSTTVTALVANGSYLFAGTYNGDIYISTNNGTSWSQASNGLTSSTIYSFEALGDQIFAGTNFGVFSSTDNGTSWNQEDAGIAFFEYSEVLALATNGTNLYAGNDNSNIYLSTDSGKSWNGTGFKTSILTDIALSGTNLFAETIDGVFLLKGNDTEWINIGMGVTVNDLLSIWASSTDLFVGSLDGGISKRSLSDILGSNAVETGNAATTSITAYPNPFTQSTTITFSSPESGVAEVTIVNLLGTEVKRIFSGEIEAGEHSFAWDAISEPPGMYECVVRVNGNSQEIPIIVER
jgi:hypothetical protein